MRFCCYLTLLLLLNTCATAQKGGGALSKKEQRSLAEARTTIDAERYGQAIAALSELIDKHPGDAELYFLRSVALRGERKYGEAAGDVRMGIEQSGGGGARPYRELGELLSLSGNFAEAKAAYQTYYDRTVSSTDRGERIAQAKALLDRAGVADSIAANPVEFSPTPVPGAATEVANYGKY